MPWIDDQGARRLLELVPKGTMCRGNEMAVPGARHTPGLLSPP